ncbi:MAG: hypothetical protein WC455_17100 [Dehalococcoidia bacterium]|jgi:hypothetical protein
MTILTKAKEAPRKVGDLQSYPVKASTKIYKGSHVSIDATGYAIASTDVAGTKYVGIAYETVDNSAVGSADGDLWIRVWRNGTHKLDAVSIAQTMVGDIMYVVDSGAFDDTAGSVNKIAIGVLEEYESATSGWVNLGIKS